MRCALAALLALGGSAFAQGLEVPAATLLRPTSFLAMPTVYSAPAAIRLWDQQPFSFRRSFGWIAATPSAFLPQFLATQSPQRLAAPDEIRNNRDGTPELLPKVDDAGGEVGFFFGKSIDGRFDLESKGGYILGEIISGKTHISVGASYFNETFSR